MAKATILVTGGAGYIGSYVNKRLNQAGYETVVFDNLSYGRPETVTRGTLVVGDLGDAEAVDALFSTYAFDAVVHMAASISVEESVANPSLYYRNNFFNSLALFDHMRNHGVMTLLFSSTAAIYGSSHKNRIDEEHPKAPINPYGRTKLMVEELLADYDAAYGFKSCSLRYFNAAGGDPDGEIPNLFTHQANLIPIIFKSLRSGNGTLVVNGTDYDTPDGTCVRDYIHLHDLAEAHLLALEELFETEESRAYNLGNGAGFSVLEVAAAARSVTGRELTLVEGPRRAGDPAILVANAQRAQHELGWQQQRPLLEQMIGDSWHSLAWH